MKLMTFFWNESVGNFLLKCFSCELLRSFWHFVLCKAGVALKFFDKNVRNWNRNFSGECIEWFPTKIPWEIFNRTLYKFWFNFFVRICNPMSLSIIHLFTVMWHLSWKLSKMKKSLIEQKIRAKKSEIFT